MTAGYWLTTADIEDVEKLISYFVNQNATLGTLEKLTIQNYNWDADDKSDILPRINSWGSSSLMLGILAIKWRTALSESHTFSMTPNDTFCFLSNNGLTNVKLSSF